jgi:Na+-translocating ferredoxin:NAD+ oxidoreductase RnfC subunit
MGSGIVEAIQAAGVIGAGGAGFPTHVKANSTVDTVIANGSECEPLLYSDQSLMELKPAEIIAGLEVMIQATGAEQGIIALKAVYTKAISAFEELLPKHPDISLKKLGSFYPSGDEQSIVYEATGRIVPEGGIPLHVGCVVDNVETLFNIHRAMSGQPVTERMVTIIGEVWSPGVYRFPIGTSVVDALQAVQGVKIDNPAVIDGGPMMGRITKGLAGNIRKTTSGLIVLPDDHPHINRRTLPTNMELIRTISMCCQCRECTDLCPRYLLGHDLEPHKVMRAIITRREDSPSQITQSHLCCLCGICETIACPLQLSPRNVFALMKKELAAKGIQNPHHRQPEAVRHGYEYTKIPKERALARCGLTSYYQHLHFVRDITDIRRVELETGQHIGAPAQPVVEVGAFVNKGDLVAQAAEGKLSTNLHASISGQVTAVAPDRIIIEA